jgi:prepilin-type processing-associated H-X9-DG protein
MRHSGLTLIEGLIVTGLVILIVLLMMPALGRPREAGRRSACASNLKRIGLAVALYADDYQGRCPTDNTNPTLVGCMQLLGKYIPRVQQGLTARTFDCPTSRPRTGETPENDFAKLTRMNIGYSYVPNLIWCGKNTNTILSLDRIYTTSLASEWPSGGNHPADVNHAGGGNVLFTDGRVEFHRWLPSMLKDKNGREIVLSP